MDKHELVSAEYLRSIFCFSGEGQLVRAVAISTAKAGDKPGTVGSDGYRRVSIRNRIFYANRIAWCLSHGAWPEKGMEVDHINGNRDDNRIENLRLVNRKKNMQNRRKAPSQSTTGLLGVRYEPRMKSNPWRAIGWLNGKNVGIGYFSDKESAHNAYLQWKRIAHEGCTI